MRAFECKAILFRINRFSHILCGAASEHVYMHCWLFMASASISSFRCLMYVGSFPFTQTYCFPVNFKLNKEMIVLKNKSMAKMSIIAKIKVMVTWWLHNTSEININKLSLTYSKYVRILFSNIFISRLCFNAFLIEKVWSHFLVRINIERP